MMYGRDTYQTIELRVTRLIPCSCSIVFLRLKLRNTEKRRQAMNSLTLCQNAQENAKGPVNKHLSTLIYQGLCLLET